MKKIAFLAAMLLMTGLLAGCSVGECEICGETGILEDIEVLGMTFEACGDCRGEAEDALDEAEDALNDLSDQLSAFADEF